MTAATARRALIGGLLAGGTGALALTEPAAAAGSWSPQAMKASALRKDDLVVGPGGIVVRIALTGRRPRYADPTDGRAIPLPKSRQYVVLARNIPASAIPLGSPPPTSVIDGGSP